MTGEPDDHDDSEETGDETVDSAVDSDVDHVGDAVARAFAAGMVVTRPDDGPWRGLVCPWCGAAFDLPAHPWWPKWTAGRIGAFVARHRHPSRQEGEG